MSFIPRALDSRAYCWFKRLTSLFFSALQKASQASEECKQWFHGFSHSFFFFCKSRLKLKSMKIETFRKWPSVSFNLNLESFSLYPAAYSCLAALSEISRGLTSGTMTILNVGNCKSSTEFSEFVTEIHRLRLQTRIFNNTKQFFKFIESNLKGSLEVTAIMFHNPVELIPQVTQRNIKFSKRDCSSIQRSTSWIWHIASVSTYSSGMRGIFQRALCIGI